MSDKKKRKSKARNLTRAEKLKHIIIANPEKSIKQCGIEAGFSEKTADRQASRALNDVETQATIQLANDKALEIAIYSKAQWLTDVIEIKDRCMQRTPILDEEGNLTGEWRFDSAGATRACDMLAKHLGLYAPESKPPINIYNLLNGGNGNGNGNGHRSEADLRRDLDQGVAILSGGNGAGINRLKTS
jgi:hypothetical protein